MRATCRIGLCAVTLIAAGCSASTIDEPFPVQLSNGESGFRMLGAVNYTNSAAEARGVVESKMDEACGGRSRLLRFDPHPDDSGPFAVVNFEALADCPH